MDPDTGLEILDDPDAAGADSSDEPYCVADEHWDEAQGDVRKFLANHGLEIGMDGAQQCMRPAAAAVSALRPAASDLDVSYQHFMLKLEAAHLRAKSAPATDWRRWGRRAGWPRVEEVKATLPLPPEAAHYSSARAQAWGAINARLTELQKLLATGRQSDVLLFRRLERVVDGHMSDFTVQGLANTA